ncbi:MAG: response regulator [Planctomycetaceae bacterium]|nr:response regulator [Planctomycetaceae bacterium]
MSHPLKIAIAEDETDLRTDLEETLQELGHEVPIAAANGRELVEQMQKIQVDLVITDICMPDLDGLTAIEQIREIQPVPVVILSAYNDDEFLQRAMKQWVLAYLVKPVNEKSLQTSIELAAQRFREFKALEEQTSNLQQALEDRKIIERAKGILMERAELSESEAFRRLQLLSSQKNQKMIEIARTIMEADVAFRP